MCFVCELVTGYKDTMVTIRLDEYKIDLVIWELDTTWEGYLCHLPFLIVITSQFLKREGKRAE